MLSLCNLLITILPSVMDIFFNKPIVADLTGGAVKRWAESALRQPAFLACDVEDEHTVGCQQRPDEALELGVDRIKAMCASPSRGVAVREINLSRASCRSGPEISAR